MTEPSLRATTATRRAAALLAHHRAQDVAGFNAVLAEITTGKESVDVLAAFCNLFEVLIPPLFSDGVNASLSQVILSMAGQEAQ